jgi:hypothetical protein
MAINRTLECEILAFSCRADIRGLFNFSKICFKWISTSPNTPSCKSEKCRKENYCYTTSMSVSRGIECRNNYGISVDKVLGGGRMYPMPKSFQGPNGRQYDD